MKEFLKKSADKVTDIISSFLSTKTNPKRDNLFVIKEWHKINLPINFTDLDDELKQYILETFNNHNHQQEWRGDIALIRSAHVNWNGVIFKNLAIYLSEINPHTKFYFSNTFLLKQWVGKNSCLSQKKTYAIVHDIWAVNNYYHWIVEALPRLLMLKEAYPNATLLIPSTSAEYVKVTSQIIGFEAECILEEGKIYQIPILVVPTKTASISLPENYGLNNNQKFGLSVVREKILAEFIKSKTKTCRKIYVSRGKDVRKRRQIANEREVISMLLSYEFEVVYFEELSFPAQVKLMAETSTLVSIHGAGLTNLMFMPAGGTVVELIKKDADNHLVYGFLASYLRLKYICLPCSNVDAFKVDNHSDINVNVKLLEMYVSKL